MKPALFDYTKPRTLEEAFSILSANKGAAKVLAGGQSLVPMMNFRVARPDVVVDINALPGLDHIRRDGDTLVIGALARHATVKDSPLVREACPLMSEAYDWVAHHPIRTRGTLCGNLCHADPASEMPAVMLAAGAQMIVAGGSGRRAVNVGDFFLGIYETALAPDEMLLEVRIPVAPPGQRFGFTETSLRKGDFALCCAAALINLRSGKVSDASVVVAGIFDCAKKLRAVEEALFTRAPEAIDLDEVAWIATSALPIHDDQRVSAEYKRDLLGAHVRRSIAKAIGRDLQIQGGM
jgi:aerobic carbon-monoxide dehydrogenase medium subunit